ncbi:MAG: hypothetical protein R3D00_18040 [Bacteroidia bacterium]
MRESAYQKALHQLGPYQKILQDSTLLSQLKELEQLDRIRQVLASPEYTEIRLDCESLDKKTEGWDREKLGGYLDSLRINDYLRFRQLQRIRSQCENLRRLEEKRNKLEQLEKTLRKAQALREKLEEAEKLKQGNISTLLQEPDALRSLGVFSKARSFLASVEKLGIGTVFPYFSPLSVNGIAVKGLEVAAN